MADRLMQRMDRHLFSTFYFHGSLAAAELSIRGWALIHDFAPCNPTTVKIHDGWKCSAEWLNSFCRKMVNNNVKSMGYAITIAKRSPKMRKKIVSQLSFFDHALNFFLAFISPEKELKKISEILDDNPKILDEVHKDLTKGRSKLGRNGLSAERILRCALLKQYKRLTYRELAERINDCVNFRQGNRMK
jgi:hypothetical protein